MNELITSPRLTRRDETVEAQGHSGRLSRLFGCSPSFSVFKYLLPAALTATMTQTDCPLAET